MTSLVSWCTHGYHTNSKKYFIQVKLAHAEAVYSFTKPEYIQFLNTGLKLVEKVERKKDKKK
jgi:hypothetical protein